MFALLGALESDGSDGDTGRLKPEHASAPVSKARTQRKVDPDDEDSDESSGRGKGKGKVKGAQGQDKPPLQRQQQREQARQPRKPKHNGDNDDTRSQSSGRGGDKDKKAVPFVKFSVELSRARTAKDKASGVDAALATLSMKKKNNKSQSKQKRKEESRELAAMEKANRAGSSDEGDEGDSSEDSESGATNGEGDAGGESGGMTAQDAIDVGREAAKVSVCLLQASEEQPAEGLYRPITSFAALLEIPGYAELVHACATTVPGGKVETLKPTAVQSECWGALLTPRQGAGPRDLIAISYTGSGKTLAFLVPILGELLASLAGGYDPCNRNEGLARPLALVVAPTRELVLQIYEVANKVGVAVGIRVVAAVGGVGFEFQQRAVLEARPHLVVATPGRLLALCGAVSSSARDKEKVFNAPCMTLGRVTSLVLDEADRLLDLGFEADLKTITTQWGNGHNFLQPDVHPRVVMTTATWAAAMNALALQFVLPGCVKITVGEKDLSASKTVTQTVEVLTRKGAFRDKRLCELLHAYLEAGIPARVLVFVLFKKEASQVATMLEAKGFKAAHLHGDMSQKQRATTLQEFRDGILPVLVATDVAARGLDVPEVTHVINTSLGLSVDHYIHRIGRCGRAGRQGTAHTFVVDYDRKFASELVMVLDQSRQSIPGELYEMAEKWDRKKSKSVTRGEAAWASGRRGEEANLDEDELAKLEAREANRSTFALVSLPLNTNQQMRTIFSFTEKQASKKHAMAKGQNRFAKGRKK